MKTPSITTTFIVAFIAALSLSACGGGGGGGGGSGAPAAATQPSSTVTSANAPDVAANAFAAAAMLNGAATDGPVPILSNSADASGGMKGKGVIDETLRQINKVLDAKSAGNLSIRAAATYEEPLACTTSGTVIVTVTEAISGAVSNGDSITWTANNCVEGALRINGSFRVEFSNISGTPSSTSAWGATLRVTYSNFNLSEGSESVTIHGDMTIAFSQASSTNASYNISGTSFSVTATSAGVTSSQTLSAFIYNANYASGVYTFRSDFTISGTFPTLGLASYVVKTNIPFKQREGSYPHEGSMTVTATDNTSLRLNVIDSVNVQIQLDKNGDGIYEESTSMTWTALESRL